ncbi:MAG: efflux RND transporter permease subunit [Gemmatimonadota bacterium]
MNPVKAALRHSQVIYVLTALAMVLGFIALREMPRREEPEITIRRGLVMAAYPGATAEQVEAQITRKVEQLLFGYSEVRKDRTVSTSMTGGLVIDVYLEPHVVDSDRVWSKIRHDLNELGASELPPGVMGPVVNSNFGDVVAILLAITGEEGVGYRELQPYMERVEEALLRLPAVARVTRVGEQAEKIFVTSTMQRLVQYGITPLHVAGALEAHNVIASAGTFDSEITEAPIRTSGLYQTEQQIRRQIVGMSPLGAPIQVQDFATVQRRLEDPDFLTRANGKPGLFLTMEVRAGNNIVDFGDEVRATLDDLRDEFPPEVQMIAVVDQPQLVEERVGHFLQEFGMALVAVVLATVVLLPLPVAMIAALAIPVTVAMTFAVLWVVGIELQQASLAGLIVALGMVVDDAIVIADNYVEMLDSGMERAEAAWRSASDIAIPVLASTLTIMAAFLPLAFLPGDMGEYMFSLPVTVAIALTNSSIVAMFLTPILCRAFIKKGLARPPEEEAARKEAGKRGFLDLLQGIYDRAIAGAMSHRRLTMAFAVLAILAGAGLSTVVDQRFFPPAERDQFAMNIWMPEGSRIEATDDVVRRIEGLLLEDPEVNASASFIGQGAPRFFFSFEPVFPTPNVAQIIIQTASVDATPGVVRRMRAALPALVPEAEVDVQELTQGNPMWAPVEVMISGPDLGVLRQLGEEVRGILAGTPGSYMVRQDWREDSYAVVVELEPEVANRMGMTNAVVSNMLAGTFLGLPVTTVWEGDKGVDVVLRLDDSARDTYEDLNSTYIVSEVARAPLRSISELRIEWQGSRIVRRNGVRTLTVGTFSQDEILPSEVLGRAQTVLDTLSMPAGYQISYGGEIRDQTESFGDMNVALLISVLGIFLILLFQFQNVKDIFVIMASIPLALFGAYFGLIITQNPFGFTAFMGLVSLTGIVVRNAIILVDYMRERRRDGATVVEAAAEAGRRRLRPIFLTTMSAAAGLTPMILGGSGLWSPLASVIAVGLIFSMVFTLVVVPVLYVLTTKDQPLPEVAT